MKTKVILTVLAMAAAIFAISSCSKDGDTEKEKEQEKEKIVWTLTTFSYTTDGKTVHPSASDFKQELEAACKSAEGKERKDAEPIISKVVKKYSGEEYVPFYLEYCVKPNSGWDEIKELRQVLK